MKTFGLLVHILRVEWLIDSIYIHKRMKEEDYQIRSFRSPNVSSSSLDEKQNSLMLNSISFHSLGGNSVPVQLNNRKSISALRKIPDITFNSHFQPAKPSKKV